MPITVSTAMRSSDSQPLATCCTRHSRSEAACSKAAPFGEQFAARLGQHGAVAAAVEQVDAQGFLELPNGVSDR